MNESELNYSLVLEQRNELRDAAINLLNFIRSKFPDDFEDGGRGFSYSFHQALDRAIQKARP